MEFIDPPRTWSGTLRGAGQSLAVIAGFVLFGLVWAALLAPPPAYTVPVESPPPAPAPDSADLWLVDGFNVLQVGLLAGEDRAQWWKAGARERLLERVRAFDRATAELWVVFDGARPSVSRAASDRGAPLTSLFHPSADAWLLAQVRAAVEPARLHLVTADRQLADRARHRGVQVISPADFLARCRT